jgi:hypothetical protein
LVALRLPKDEPLVQALVDAIHAGEVERVSELIGENQASLRRAS